MMYSAYLAHHELESLFIIVIVIIIVIIMYSLGLHCHHAHTGSTPCRRLLIELVPKGVAFSFLSFSHPADMPIHTKLEVHKSSSS